MKAVALRSALALACTAVAVPAMAYEAGDILVRFGAAHVAPDSSSKSALGDIVEVGTDTQLGASLTYMFDSSFGVEVLGATPFSHELEGKGALAGVAVGETKHLPPTVSVQWYPQTGNAFHPYLGVGLNYTMFFSAETSPQLTAALGATTTDIELEDSLGLALQAGLDYDLGDNLVLNAAVWNIDIDTTADVSANGALAATVDVEIDPWVYMVGMGIKF